MTEELILGVKINFGFTVKSAATYILQSINDSTSRLICTTNPEFVVKSMKDGEFRDVINKSFLSLPDGIGIFIGKKYVEYRQHYHSSFSLIDILYKICLIPASYVSGLLEGSKLRIPGVDLVEELCYRMNSGNYSVFLLGASSSAAASTAQYIRHKYTNVTVVGHCSQYTPDATHDAPTHLYIKECMKKSNVEHLDFLFVAYRFGAQEKWLARNIKNIPARVGIGVGGTFDYLSGEKKRAPYAFRKIGLEWLYRLFTQPYRLARIFTAVVVYTAKLIKFY